MSLKADHGSMLWLFCGEKARREAESLGRALAHTASSERGTIFDVCGARVLLCLARLTCAWVALSLLCVCVLCS